MKPFFYRLLSVKAFTVLLAGVMFSLPVSGQKSPVVTNPSASFNTPAVTANFSQAAPVENKEVIGDADQNLQAVNETAHRGQLPVILGPPGNDNCSSGLGPLYTLFPGATCTAGTLNGSNPSPAATVEAGETFGCMAGPPTRTVWYNFTATSTSMWVSIESTGAIVCSQNFGLRVYNYTGVCPPASASQVGCKAYTAYSAQNVFNVLSMTGLVIGNTYMIQVGQNPACGRYPFCIQIGETSTCTTCNNVCGPMCNYAGPTAPTPTQITTNCTGYPLSPPMNQFDTQTNCFTFTAPNDTISLQMIVQSYCGGGMYTFNYTLYTAGCSVIASNSIFTNNTITGLVPGTNYRICYTFETACSTTGSIWPYVYTTSTVLPVELIYFDAFASPGKTELFWTTASEINSLEFVVERTRDGKIFEQISRVKAAGNSVTNRDYHVVDSQPLDGVTYYRLRQIDIDGTENVSKLIVARQASLITQTQLFPNPAAAQTILKLHTNQSGVGKIEVIDVLGRVVMNFEHELREGLNVIQIDTDELPQGTYTVRTTMEDDQVSLRLLKN